MSSLSVTTPQRTRRRFSPEFKASIVAQCLQPGVSEARIALDNDLNTNLVWRWVSQAREGRSLPATPGFMPTSYLKRNKFARRSEQLDGHQGLLLEELVDSDIVAIEAELAELTEPLSPDTNPHAALARRGPSGAW